MVAPQLIDVLERHVTGAAVREDVLKG